jgi:hypothetical protein
MPVKKTDVRRCKSKLVYKNPSIPDAILDQDDFMEKFLAMLDHQHSTDSPSSSDLMSIFGRYNAASPKIRDTIDAVFVWFSGYSLTSLAAMAVARPTDEYTDLVTMWRLERGSKKRRRIV